MVLASEIKQWIETGLSGAQAMVEGDGRHFEAVIIYSGFQDKTTIQQHRMVYDALGDKMHSTIHALSIKTYPHKQE